MKAIKVQNPASLDNLQEVDLPGPDAPKAGEMTVRLHASSLNYHDYGVVSGGIPTEDGRIPMSDGAGVVEAVGDGVSEFQKGDFVVSRFFPTWDTGPAKIGDFTTTPGDGIDGYAREMVTRPAHYFTPTPKDYSHKESATLVTAGLTAWRSLVVDAGIKAGDTVLVLGTGGVSIFALQFAKAMGASVIATSSSDEKLEKVKGLGADHTINYKSTPEWGKKVQEITRGRGVDIVVEVGGPATLDQSLRAVRIGGHLSLIGTLTGLSGEVPTRILLAKQAKLQGLIVGSRDHQLDMIRAIDNIGLKPVIDTTFSLSDLGEAFRYEEAGKHFGKICVSI